MREDRNIEIEFSRIISCFIVICLHTSSWYMSEKGITHSALLIKCFLQDAVPVFWYIMGYFLFTRNISFIKLLKKTSTNVFLPAFLMMIVSQIISPWIYGVETLINCFVNLTIDMPNLLGNLVQWKSSMTLGGHFWYIFSYIKVILWYPLILQICNTSDNATKCRYYLYILAFSSIIITDVQQIKQFVVNDYTYKLIPFSVIDTTILHVLLGYEISLHKEWINKKRNRIFGMTLVLFVLFNLQRYFLQVELFNYNQKNDYFLHIDSFNSFLSSVSLFLALLTIPFKKVLNEFGNIICVVSKKTFGIYIVHRCIYEKMNNMGIRDFVYAAVRKNDTLFVRGMCTIAYATFIFIISYFVVVIFQQLKKKLKSLATIFVKRGVLNEKI